MNIVEFTQSSGFTKLLNKLWYWGIIIALLGGVFLINDWPYSNIILSIAGFVLILVYFFASFEPLHEKVDWTLVYPQLAGIHDDKEIEPVVPLIETKKLKKEIDELKKEIELLEKK